MIVGKHNMLNTTTIRNKCSADSSCDDREDTWNCILYRSDVFFWL